MITTRRLTLALSRGRASLSWTQCPSWHIAACTARTSLGSDLCWKRYPCLRGPSRRCRTAACPVGTQYWCRTPAKHSDGGGNVSAASHCCCPSASASVSAIFRTSKHSTQTAYLTNGGAASLADCPLAPDIFQLLVVHLVPVHLGVVLQAQASRQVSQVRVSAGGQAAHTASAQRGRTQQGQASDRTRSR